MSAHLPIRTCSAHPETNLVHVVVQLIEQAFDHLVSSKFGAPAASDGAGPSNAQAANTIEVHNEDDAFESERAQMRAAMQQSEAEAAAYNAVHHKPEQQWSSADYKQQFPNSVIVEKECPPCSDE